MDTEDFKREHPSYGMLHVTRVSSSGKVRLFGSPLATHYGTIRLSVSKGQWTHDSHGDRYFGMGKEFIEIEMSAAQFADAITSLNLGEGTPCTIRCVGGKPVPGPPDLPTEAEHIQKTFRASIGEYRRKARTYRQRIEALTSKLSAKARDEIRIALDVMEDQLGQNVPFILDQLQQASNRVTTAARAEVEAFVANLVRSAGLASLTQGRLPQLLPGLASDSKIGALAEGAEEGAGVGADADEARAQAPRTKVALDDRDGGLT